MTIEKSRELIRVPLPGMVVTGAVGGLIGWFIGGAIWILGMAIVGALLGMIVWRLGGRRFFLCVVIGASVGAALAMFISGTESLILGGATGGAMGGFVGVNLSMLRPRTPS